MSDIMNERGVSFGRNGRSILIPGWFIAMFGIVASIFTAGWLAQSKFSEVLNTLQWVDYRLCRIESELNLNPWPSCNGYRFVEPPQSREQGE